MKILSFGEVLFDLIEGEAHLGGAPLNFAVNCSRLGAEANILSALGTDELGASAREQIAALGLSTEHLQEISDKTTGRVEVSLHNGQPSYAIRTDVAYDYISANAALNSIKEQEFDLFYFGTLAQRSSGSRQALKELMQQLKFKELFFDCNLRQDFYYREVLEDSLNYASILKLNDEELPIISRMLYKSQMQSQEACRMLAHDFDLKCIILTAGAEGATVYYEGQRFKVPAEMIDVADTVGAGDAFSAAFAVNLLAGQSIQKSLESGNKLGAYVASQNGALPSLSPEIKQACSPKQQFD